MARIAQLGRHAVCRVWSVHGPFANEVLMACSNAIACPFLYLPELSNKDRVPIEASNGAA